jgi:hypothetical protein
LGKRQNKRSVELDNKINTFMHSILERSFHVFSVPDNGSAREADAGPGGSTGRLHELTVWCCCRNRSLKRI